MSSISVSSLVLGSLTVQVDGTDSTLALSVLATAPAVLSVELGTPGAQGDAATIAVGTTTTLSPGASATVTNAGTSSAAVFNFGIPAGAKGDTGNTGPTGAAATISVGSTSTGAAGSSASVANSGTSSAAVFDFTVPRGDKGDKGDTGNTGATGSQGPAGTAATATAGTTTTGAPGTSASVVNAGTTSAAVFNFTIPRGDVGETGATGDPGPAGPGVPTGGTAGQLLSKVDGTDYNTQFVDGYISPSANQLTAGVVSANPTTGPVADWASLYYASGDLYWSTSVAAVQITNGYATSLAANPTPGQFLKFNATSQLEWADVSGSGLPAGGAAGESLLKVDATDYNVTWGVPAHATSSEVVTATVRNNTGVTLTEGQVVYINGALGNRPTVALAQANSEATSAGTYGMVSAAIPDNTDGTIVIAGYVANLDTQGFTDGDKLYLSPTVAGGWTTTKPSAPDHMVYVGVIARAHPTLGVIQLRIANGFELEELHNVSAQTPSDNDLLAYDSATSLWKNESASTLGLLTTVTAGTIFAPIYSPIFTGTVTLPFGSIIPGYATTSSLSAYAALTGATFSGLVSTVASTTATAGLRVPHGAAPTTPTNGDIWTTTANVFARINGATQTLVPTTGATFTGKVNTLASATGGAGLNLPHGSNPSAPVNGDIWTTTTNLAVRLNGTTYFPAFTNIGNIWGGTGRNSFYHTSTISNISVNNAGALAGDPTTINNGDIWYSPVSNQIAAMSNSMRSAMTACRAFVNFNGTGTVAIRSNFNVSSITDNGVGDYTLNFAVAMVDVNYAVINGTSPAAGTSATAGAWFSGVKTDATGAAVSKLVGSCRVATAQLTSGTLIDCPEVYFAIFR